MDIINRYVISEFLHENPDATTALAVWYKLVLCSNWSSFQHLRCTFPSAEKFGQNTVFSVGCGSIFVDTYVDYRRRKLFVREVYDKQHLQ